MLGQICLAITILFFIGGIGFVVWLFAWGLRDGMHADRMALRDKYDRELQ